MTHDFGEGADNFSECRQALVDVCTFLEPRAFSSGGIGALRTREINKRYFADFFRDKSCRTVLSLLGEENRKHRVRSTRCLVHVRRCDSPVIFFSSFMLLCK